MWQSWVERTASFGKALFFTPVSSQGYELGHCINTVNSSQYIEAASDVKEYNIRLALSP